jgi:acetolactate synthase-1/2/3 large subunit
VKVYDAMAGEVRRQGVTAVFALQSEETLRFSVALSQLGVTIYKPRHEAGAVAMADGYRRVSGSVGVAVIGRGPGFTNGLTATVTAHKARVEGQGGVVIFAGDTQAGIGRISRADAVKVEGRRGKHLEESRLLESIGVTHIVLRSPESATADVEAAFAYARSGAAIVVLMPADVLQAEAGNAPASVSLSPVKSPAPDPDDIAAVADLLEATFTVKRPVILAGQGATLAHDDLVRLGERIGALLATTLKARTLFRDEPYDIGVCGTYSTPAATQLLAEADLVLAFGASLNNHTTYGGDLLKKARVVHFDSDPEALGRFVAPAIAVKGDTGAAARALVAELERRGHQATGYRTPDVAARIESGSALEPFKDVSAPGALDPRTLMQRIESFLPRERTVVQDGAYNQRFSTTYLSVPDAQSFILPREFEALGSAMGQALGAAVARPDRITVLCTGDGGFMMSSADFDTAIRYGMKLLVLLSDNGGFGAEVLMLRRWGLPDDVPAYDSPPFAAMAAGLGATSVLVETLDDIAKIEPLVRDMQGPVLVHCKVALEVPFKDTALHLSFLPVG